MRGRWALIWLLAALLVMGPWAGVLAAPPAPQTPPEAPCPPVPPPPIVESPAEPFGILDLPPLKAVLIVGPIDGDGGPRTVQEIVHMEMAAAELEANGVTVHRFYTPQNDWNQIVAAADGAHFLLYRGHGVFWSPMPSPEVGGFSLKNRLISPDQIRVDLNLAPHAIVMLYGCFTAGSTTSDSDYGPITSEEAQRRVAQYSDPFLDIGVGGYYANWFGDAFQMYVRYLFQGMTLGEAYESFYDFRSETVERYMHPNHPDLVMWLDKDYWWEAWQYDNAFAELPDQTLSSLFEPSEMVIEPLAVAYLAEPDSPPRFLDLRIESSNSVTFTWTVTPSPPGDSWSDVQPRSGTSDQEATVVVTPTGQAPGLYQASLHIVADDPELVGRDQTLSITLQIADRVYPVYLPVVSVSATDKCCSDTSD